MTALRACLVTVNFPLVRRSGIKFRGFTPVSSDSLPGLFSYLTRTAKQAINGILYRLNLREQTNVPEDWDKVSHAILHVFHTILSIYSLVSEQTIPITRHCKCSRITKISLAQIKHDEIVFFMESYPRWCIWTLKWAFLKPWVQST